jgi:hypothetical protein
MVYVPEGILVNPQDAKRMFEDTVNEIARRASSESGSALYVEVDKMLGEMHPTVYAMLVIAIDVLELELCYHSVTISDGDYTLKNLTKEFTAALLEQEASKCLQPSEAADGSLKMG